MERNYAKLSLTRKEVDSILRAAPSVDTVMNTRHKTVKANGWKETRYEYEMRKRQASPVPLKDEIVNVSDDDQRRVEVISAYTNNLDAGDKGQLDELHNNVTHESLDEEGMRGDIARAFVESEENEHA